MFPFRSPSHISPHRPCCLPYAALPPPSSHAFALSFLPAPSRSSRHLLAVAPTPSAPSSSSFPSPSRSLGITPFPSLSSYLRGNFHLRPLLASVSSPSLPLTESCQLPTRSLADLPTCAAVSSLCSLIYHSSSSHYSHYLPSSPSRHPACPLHAQPSTPLPSWSPSPLPSFPAPSACVWDMP
ncbi:hypothetical protein EDB89DRAFT_862964 [Lactarius sanguifluus]|nr:hypothetical protein EDB89DRAFT_862964 [Lactarius sanguifluus]